VEAIRQLPPVAQVIVCGDFNDDADSPALQYLSQHGLHNVTSHVQGTHGAKATYRYQGFWQSIDHVFVSPSMLSRVDSATIHDAPFLLVKDKKYGGVKPFRTFDGYRYKRGFSDHLPLVVRFR
jgi:predicted extracellular nuclease